MLHIRPFQMQDMPAFLNAISDAAMLMQFAGPSYEYPLTAAQVEIDLQAADARVFSIVTDANQVVGHAQMQLLPNGFLLRRIVIWDASLRGQGWGKKIMQQLLDLGYALSPSKVVHLNVFDWNAPAIRCYQSLGFVVQEGVEKHVQVGNETWRSLHMCLQPSNKSI